MLKITDIPGRETVVDGKRYLFFSGFAYLGMPSLSVFQDTLAEGIRRYGAVYPSSRLSNTPLELYEAFERELAAFTLQEAALSFSSGYLAASAAVRVCAKDSILLFGPSAHPSLKPQTANHKIFTSERWETEIATFLHESVGASHTIVLESVNPLTGRLQDLSWLANLRHPVRVLVDDSHGIGILGDGGAGIAALLPRIPSVRYMICFSLSKAFSCEGGVVAGGYDDITALRQCPEFSAATPMSPAFAYTWMQSGSVFDLQRERLRRNVAYLYAGLSDRRLFLQDPRIPVCYTRESDFYFFCLKRSILLSAFTYPSASDPLVVRAVLNAMHTVRDLDSLVESIDTYEREKNLYFR